MSGFVRPTTVATTVVDEDDDTTVSPARVATDVTGLAKDVISLTDVVPAFRADLKLQRRSSGDYQVVEPSSGRVVVLNGLEVSIIRMLDGKRRVSEVLENCRRLEIPTNAESLNKFILQLESDGLLGTAGPVETTTWTTRVQWESSVRALFQSGIRLLRMGKRTEAANYFEALLQEDPDNIEARELLAMTQAPVEPAVAVRPTPVPEPIAIAAPAVPADTAPQASMPVMPDSRFRRPLQIGLVAVAAIAIGAAIFVFTARQSGTTASVAIAPASSEARATTSVDQAKSERAALARVDRTARVKQEPPATLENDPPATEKLDTQVEPAPQAEAKPAPQAVPIEPPAEQPAPTQAVEPALVTAPHRGSVRAFLRSQRKVRRGEVLFEITRPRDSTKTKALSAKVAELTELAQQDPIYEPFLADARAKLTAAKKVHKTKVVAPQSGHAVPRVKQGARVSTGSLLVEIK
jgi:hypothetical protein